MTKEQLTRINRDLETKNRKLVGSLMHIHTTVSLNAKEIRDFVKGELTAFINDDETFEKPKRTRKTKELEPA